MGSTYQGIEISEDEQAVLVALETLIGESLPNKNASPGESFCFVEENGHVTRLDLSICSQDHARDRKPLDHFPEEITRLTWLTHLGLGWNAIKTIPESIGKLVNLKFLFLAGNRLTTLPESIGLLANLLDLTLGSNPLTSLPNGIGKLQSLKKIDLSETALKSLPRSMTKLKSLYCIDLKETESFDDFNAVEAILKVLAKNGCNVYYPVPFDEGE